MRKPLLCKLGLHAVKKGEHYEKRNWKNYITSRSAFCRRCGKKLYLVDRYGEKIKRGKK